MKKLTIVLSILLLMFRSVCYAADSDSTIEYLVDDSFLVEEVIPIIERISSFRISETCKKYAAFDGVLYSKDGSRLIAYPAAKTDKSYCVEVSTEVIEAYAFAHASLELIDFPTQCNIKEIHDYAFTSCTNLRQLFLPNTVSYIGYNIISECGSNMTVIAENDSTAYQYFDAAEITLFVELEDQNDLYEWISLSDYLYAYPLWAISYADIWLSKGALYQNETMIAYPQKSECKFYEIPEGVKAVNAAIFTNPYIETLKIPASCTALNTYQYEESSFQAYIVSDDNPMYASKDGVLYSKDGSILISYPANRLGDKYVVPASVDTLGHDCFENSQNVKDVVWENGVKEILSFAFWQSSIESIRLPATLETIEYEAFENCPHLTAIYVLKDSYAEQFFYEIKDALNFIDILHVL